MPKPPVELKNRQVLGPVERRLLDGLARRGVPPPGLRPVALMRARRRLAAAGLITDAATVTAAGHGWLAREKA